MVLAKKKTRLRCKIRAFVKARDAYRQSRCKLSKLSEQLLDEITAHCLNVFHCSLPKYKVRLRVLLQHTEHALPSNDEPTIIVASLDDKYLNVEDGKWYWFYGSPDSAIDKHVTKLVEEIANDLSKELGIKVELESYYFSPQGVRVGNVGG